MTSCEQIHILGTVGAGKSSLSKLLSVREGITLFEEPVLNNPYLEKLYENPKGFSFQNQIFLTHARYKQAMEAQKLDKCVMDMSIYGNEIFAKLMWERGDMSEEDYKTYIDVASSLKNLIEPPKLMVYLQCSPEVSVQRIVRRFRASELQAPLIYWFHLNRIYQEWYREYNLGKKMLINVDSIDFVNEDDDEDYVVDMIMEEFNRE